MTGCWNWNGSDKTYGSFCGEPAHRFSYKTWNAPIPPKRVIDHMCQNKRCVNPDHLDCVTPRTNTRRAVKLGHAIRQQYSVSSPFAAEHKAELQETINALIRLLRGLT